MESTLKSKRAPLTPEQRQRRADRARLLELLTYEMWDGKPVYYAGYRDVLNGTKTVEQVMSSSLLQSRIAARLLVSLSKQIDESVYEILGNELGVQFRKGDWRACDLAIFDITILEDQDLTKYAWVPPKIVIEVDTKADFTRFSSDFDYYQKKTTRLIRFGVERVIWIFTETRKVWVAEPDKDWILRDWSQPVEVMPDCRFTLDELMPPKK